ncbi:MAG: CoA transferase [Chloroflexota bacterium]|nr:MAG: CoA transferase [Chloroflexota bacterium]
MTVFHSCLEGVTVLDLSSHVAGPYCTRLLAGLGARVVKVEPPGGDVARSIGPFLEDSPSIEHSALFHHLNPTKKSIVLDLTLPSARSTVRELARSCQVLIESYPPGVMAAHGLGYESLCAENSSLVMTSISDFGQTGPYRHWRANDLVHLAMGGVLGATGASGREPLKLAGYQSYYQAGLNAAVATLAALDGAERTGLGQHLDISVMESLARLVALGVARRTADDVSAPQRFQGAQVLPCKDGFIVAMVPNDAGWDLLAAVVDPEGLTLSGPTEPLRRAEAAEEIRAALQPWLRVHTREELYCFTQELRLPFAMVLSPEEVLADPQHRERRFFSTEPHPIVRDVLQVGAPFVMQETPWRLGRAPTLGEHDAEILGELSKFGGSTAREMPSPKRGVLGAACRTGRAVIRPEPVLGGVRVVDLTAMWSGPYCTRVLADLGAEVIKIEPAIRKDGTRAHPMVFERLNHNKLGLALNLNLPEGREIFRDLVRRSSVLVENFSPRVMQNFGLDYAALRALKPNLIMLSMPAYGSTGPYQNHVSYGPGIEAMSGMAWLNGYEGGPPVLAPPAYADLTAGLHGAVATLAALRHLRQTGRGQVIDLAQRESLSQVFGETLVLAAESGEIPGQRGNHHPTLAPHGCYRCAGGEGWIAIAVADDGEWRRLCAVIGDDALAEDPRFKTREARKAHEDELDQAIEACTRQREQLELARILQTNRVTAGAVLDWQTLLSDEHLIAREFFLGGEHPGLETIGTREEIQCRPHRPSPVVYQPAPRLGQHNRDILGGLLGLTDQEIHDLELTMALSFES